MQNNIDDKNGSGFLLLALTQDHNMPYKIKLLEAALTKENSLLAGILLANIYKYGVEKDGQCIIASNIKKAKEIYEDIINRGIDPFGIIDWELGYLYEKNIGNTADDLTDVQRILVAYTHYLCSAQKGFAKGYNSVGNFYYRNTHNIICNIQYDEETIADNYKKAADLGDVYALLNYGLFSMRKYYDSGRSDNAALDLAEKCFLDAITYNCNEAVLHLGLISEEKGNYSMAIERYIETIQYAKKQIKASAYYLLGRLVWSQRIDFLTLLDDKALELLNVKRSDDLASELFQKAYYNFYSLEESGTKIDVEYKKYYDELRKCFSSI